MARTKATVLAAAREAQAREQAPTRTKQTARKTTAKTPTKAVPKATKVKATGKAAIGTKGTAKPKSANKGKTYIVKTLTEWRPSGFHSYQGPGESKTDSVHKSIKAANARAKVVFFKHNPWGLGEDKIEDMEWEERADREGLATFAAYPPDSETWKVFVEEVKPLGA